MQCCASLPLSKLRPRRLNVTEAPCGLANTASPVPEQSGTGLVRWLDQRLVALHRLAAQQSPDRNSAQGYEDDAPNWRVDQEHERADHGEDG